MKFEGELVEQNEGQTIMLKPTALSLFNEHLNFFLSNNEGAKVLATLEKEF